MRKQMKKDKIFIYTSILFIASLFIIYGCRFIHYYRLDKKMPSTSTEVSEPISMYNHLLTYLTNEDIGLSNNSNLVKNDNNNEYYFEGQVDNNYVYYSGRLWRIVKTDENKNITLITEEVQTLLPYGEKTN